MAHADYACCACCDSKVYYKENAASKSVLCERCAEKISEIVGKPIVTVSQFRNLIENFNDKKLLFSLLKNINFHFCIYSNPFDQMISEKIGNEYTEEIKELMVGSYNGEYASLINNCMNR